MISSRRFWACVALSMVGACSLLTKPESGELMCKITADRIDPCPAGLSCKDGQCQKLVCHELEICGDGIDNDCDDRVDEAAFADGREECNQLDDDCDGNIDEGISQTPELCDQIDNDCDLKIDEDFDFDGDGYTTCGDGTFTAMSYDCDPRNKAVHPYAVEICDGLDNDCDENTDEGSSADLQCKPGDLCIRGACTSPSCAVPGTNRDCKSDERCVNDECVKQKCDPPCRDKEFCDPATLSCVPLPQHPNGGPCTTDDDCQSHTCIDTVVLRLTLSNTRRVCGKACCSALDCPEGETCYASGTGSRSCMPESLLVNVPASGCMQTPDCRGGDEVCAAAESSVLQNDAGAPIPIATSVCTVPTSGARKYTQDCPSSAYCETNLCVRGPVFGPDRCSAPCRDARDCTALRLAATILSPVQAYCQYVDLGVYKTEFAGNYMPICLLSQFDGDVGAGASGAPCRAGRECADATCIGATSENRGKCAKPCCSDAQCKTKEQPYARCLPVARGLGRYEMRCLE